MYLAKALDPIKDAMILPEVTDESKWWRGRHHYRDPEKRFALVFIGNPDFGSVFYNSSLVKPKEIQSLWDLLNPKWKGRIAARDIRIPGGGGTSVKMFYKNFVILLWCHRKFLPTSSASRVLYLGQLVQGW